jgi:hypothetical protein
MIRVLLRLAPAFIIYSAANAQAPPVVPDVPGAPPSSEDIVVPHPDTSDKDVKIRVPFGGIKDLPGDSAPQTGSATTIPSQPLSDPSNGEPVIVIIASALGFMAGYGVRSVVSRHHKTQSRRRLG